MTRGSGDDPDIAFEPIYDNYDGFRMLFLQTYQGSERERLIEKYSEIEEMISEFLYELETAEEDEGMLQAMVIGLDYDKQTEIAAEFRKDFVGFYIQYGGGNKPTEEQLSAVAKWQQAMIEAAAVNRRNEMQLEENEYHPMRVFNNIIDGQHVDGYWTLEGQKGLEQMIPQKKIEDPGVYAALNKFKLTLPEGISPNNVYLTLLALYILKVEWPDR